MKTRSFILVAFVVFVSLVWLESAVAQTTGVVYQITMSGNVLGEEDVGDGQTALAKGKFSTEVMINIARGRDGEAAVPPNEVLALSLVFVEDGPPSTQLIVYDTNTQSNLATIATFQTSGVFDSRKNKGVIAMAGEVGPVGGFTGGWLAMTGKAQLGGAGSEPMLTALRAKALQGLLAGSSSAEDFYAIIAKGKVALIGQVGILVIPPS